MEGETLRKIKKLFNQSIDSSKLNPGDHIYVYRAVIYYSHHGIYLGGENQYVIHFTRKDTSSTQGKPCPRCGYDKSKSCGGVVKSCLDCFIKEEYLFGGQSLHLYEYGVSKAFYTINTPGTCSTRASKPPKEVIKIATELHKNNEFGEYDLIRNNCEDFATFCKTGTPRSAQVEAGFNAVAIAAAGAAAVGIAAVVGIAAMADKDEERKKKNFKQIKG